MNVGIVAGLFAFQGAGVIDLHVDATDGPRNLLRVTETVPANPGPLALRYPRWIPGNHRPSGPINEVIGFHVFAADQELAWRRDPVDMNEIRVRVPDGGHEVVIKFVVGEAPGEGWSSVLGRLRWNRVVFLPPGEQFVQYVHPTITAPPGWSVMTTLGVKGHAGNDTDYETVTAERLVDSPAVMGAYAKTVELAPNHFLDVATQERRELDLRPEIVADLRNLVEETGAIFGARHYRQYHFLATFCNWAGNAGLEHNECCEVGTSERALTGDAGLGQIGDLFSHEMFHSWNGKYRRPAGLVTPDFMVPQQTELVWVYEGMTEYYGNVLAARAGFQGIPASLDRIASEVVGQSERAGRSWRSVADTAVSASILRENNEWSTNRRQQDYYPESVATWLEVDCTIRKLTDGRKSLDDFCRAFEGAPGGVPAVFPYTYAEVVAALNRVVPFDWNGLFQRRVYDVHPGPLTEAFAAAGWRPVYTEKPNAMDAALALNGGIPKHMSDIGVNFDKTGVISDMALGSPADRAGLTPGMKIVGVNARTFSEETYEQALREAKLNPAPITLIVEREGKLATLRVGYHDGFRHPHLERIPGTHDYLTETLTPRTRR